MISYVIIEYTDTSTENKYLWIFKLWSWYLKLIIFAVFVYLNLLKGRLKGVRSY